MALGKNCKSKVKRGGLNRSSSFNATDEKLCVLQSRKRVLSSCIEAMSESSPFQTPLKKQCCTKLNTLEESLIEALPQDILIKILCGVEHNDLKQLFHVSNKIRDATLIAKQWHFAYSTPTSKIRGVKLFDGLEESSKFDSVETPNAPRQQRFSYKSRISDQKLAELNIALFHSKEEVQPWSSRRKRLLLETLILFGVLYIINLGIILFIYVKTDVVALLLACSFPGGLFSCCLSKRVHSIFVLRLFNDCFAMTLLHAAVALLIHKRWHLSLIIFSMSICGVITALAGAALVQILLGLPILLSYPVANISSAFNLGCVFIHFWTVNFKFVPEDVFVSKEFALSLLIIHLALLIAFAHYRWYKYEGGLLRFLGSRFNCMKLENNVSSSFQDPSKEYIATTLFVGNFIGIICAQSLHYQFYLWYFYTLPFLPWSFYSSQTGSVRRGGDLLECISLECIFVLFALSLPFSHTLGSLDCSI